MIAMPYTPHVKPTKTKQQLEAELAKVRAQLEANNEQLTAAQAALDDVKRRRAYLIECEKLLQLRRDFGAAQQRKKEKM